MWCGKTLVPIDTCAYRYTTDSPEVDFPIPNLGNIICYKSMGKMQSHWSIYRMVHDCICLLTHNMNKQVRLCMPENSCYRWYNHPINFMFTQASVEHWNLYMQWIDWQSLTMNRQSTSPIYSLNSWPCSQAHSQLFNVAHFFSISSFFNVARFSECTIKKLGMGLGMRLLARFILQKY